MEKEQTAFKHPNCGGVIMQYNSNGNVVFECDACGEQADEIDSLILRGLVIIRHGSPEAKSRESESSDGSLEADSPT